MVPTSDRGTNFDWIVAGIDAHKPFVFQDCCVGSKYNNVSYAYVMLYSTTSTSWAQIGPAILNDGSRADLIQCMLSGVPTDFVFTSSAQSTTPTFKVAQTIGGVDVYKNGIDQHTCPDFSVGAAEFSGEILEAHDQMPGDESNYDTFHNSQVKKHNDSTIYDGYGNGAGVGDHVGTGEWFGRTRPDDQTMNIWDHDCSRLAWVNGSSSLGRWE